MTIKPVIFWTALAFLPTACSGIDMIEVEKLDVPKATENDYLTQTALLKIIDCDLRSAVYKIAKNPEHSFVLEQKALIKLTLKVIEVNDQKGNFTLAIPLGVTNLTVKNAFGSNQTSTSTNSFSIKIDRLGDLECMLDEKNAKVVDALGLKSFINQTTTILKDTGKIPSEVVYSTNFKVKNSGSITPTLEKANADINTVGGAFSRDRTLEHTLSISVEEFDPKITNKKRTRTSRKETFDKLQININNFEIITNLANINN